MKILKKYFHSLFMKVSLQDLGLKYCGVISETEIIKIKTAELSEQTCLEKTKFYQSNLDPTIYGILDDQFKSRSFSSGQLYVCLDFDG